MCLQHAVQMPGPGTESGLRRVGGGNSGGESVLAGCAYNMLFKCLDLALKAGCDESVEAILEAKMFWPDVPFKPALFRCKPNVIRRLIQCRVNADKCLDELTGRDIIAFLLCNPTTAEEALRVMLEAGVKTAHFTGAISDLHLFSREQSLWYLRLLLKVSLDPNHWNLAPCIIYNNFQSQHDTPADCTTSDILHFLRMGGLRNLHPPVPILLELGECGELKSLFTEPTSLQIAAAAAIRQHVKQEDWDVLPKRLQDILHLKDTL